jgi:hypothetical protein
MGTSSEWFLCEDQSALNALLDRLAAGAEVHLNSVWDLKNPAGGIVFRTGQGAGLQPDSERGGAAGPGPFLNDKGA